MSRQHKVKTKMQVVNQMLSKTTSSFPNYLITEVRRGTSVPKGVLCCTAVARSCCSWFLISKGLTWHITCSLSHLPAIPMRTGCQSSSWQKLLARLMLYPPPARTEHQASSVGTHPLREGTHPLRHPGCLWQGGSSRSKQTLTLEPDLPTSIFPYHSCSSRAISATKCLDIHVPFVKCHKGISLLMTPLTWD